MNNLHQSQANASGAAANENNAGAAVHDPPLSLNMLNIRQQQQGDSSGGVVSRRRSSIDVIDVGTPRHPSGWSTTVIRYHNFSHLPHRKGDSTDSQPFRAHGLDWYLRIHPGGAASANGDGMVSLYLRCKSAADQNVAVQAEFSLALQRTDGQIDSMMSCPCNAFRRKRKGWPNFISRCRVLDGPSQLLDEFGTLTVIVKVQLFQERDTNFVPKNDIGLIKLLKDVNHNSNATGGDDDTDEQNSDNVDNGGGSSSMANTADVKFIVEGDTIYAHRLILQLAAPALAELCEDGDKDTEIPIVQVRSPIFQGVLRFAYGDVVPDEVWTMPITTSTDNDSSILTSPAMELLDAANQFGVVGLKILAETKVAESEISISNASDLILYADSHNCPLLKERVVDYFIVHAEEIRKHPSYQKIKESADILDELMEALINKRMLRSFSLGDNDVDYESMGVNLLRRKLDERGLDVDGSREMLIQRLVDWDNRGSQLDQDQ